MPAENSTQKRHRSCKEVSKVMGVTPAAVRSWARAGRYKSKRTPGGHYRLEVDADEWPIEQEKKR